MFTIRAEEDRGFQGEYDPIREVKIFYYIRELYSDKIAELVDALCVADESDEGVESWDEVVPTPYDISRMEAETAAFAHWVKAVYPSFDRGKNPQNVQLLLTLVNLKVAFEALIINWDGLKEENKDLREAGNLDVIMGFHVALNEIKNAMARMEGDPLRKKLSDAIPFLESKLDMVVTELKWALKNKGSASDKSFFRTSSICALGVNFIFQELLNYYTDVRVEGGLK